MDADAQRIVESSAAEGVVFNIQRYSVDDGPGIRTTVFLKGCPLRCPWCSNPESQSGKPQLQYRVTACKHCGECAKVCPNGAITAGADGMELNRDKCVVCGACVRECVADALKISGEVMTVDKVWRTIRKDAVYYETSGGGVTCSGGEILAQPDFVAAIFRRCREEGIYTCADTSGYGTGEAMKTVLEYADLLYFDIKHADPARHMEMTGVPLEPVLRNLKTAVESGAQIVLRIPLIPEFNSGQDEIRAMARLAAEYCPGGTAHILPYHKYGAAKYASIGTTYALENLRDVTDGEKHFAKRAFEEAGLVCEVLAH